MASSHIVVGIRFTWWLHWYLAGVMIVARLSGLEPDCQRVGAWVVRSTRLTVNGRRHIIRQGKSEAI